MKTPGSIMASVLPAVILGTTLVLFILLPISPTNENTLVENIFGLTEDHQEKKEE